MIGDPPPPVPRLLAELDAIESAYCFREGEDYEYGKHARFISDAAKDIVARIRKVLGEARAVGDREVELRTKCCTCLGVCKGREGLGPGWHCALDEEDYRRLAAGAVGDRPPQPSAGELLIQAADKLCQHMRGCDNDECADCAVVINQLRLAHKVWENSEHKRAGVPFPTQPPQDVPPWVEALESALDRDTPSPLDHLSEADARALAEDDNRQPCEIAREVGEPSKLTVLQHAVAIVTAEHEQQSAMISALANRIQVLESCNDMKHMERGCACYPK